MSKILTGIVEWFDIPATAGKHRGLYIPSLDLNGPRRRRGRHATVFA